METKRLLSEIVESDEIYIIFGGPSLKGFDFSNLDNVPTLGCNKSSEVYQTDAVISVDCTYLNTRKNFLKDYEGYVAIGRRETKPSGKVIDDINPNWLYWYDNRFPEMLSEDPNVLSGTNTGQCSINFAVHHGFKTIHALGLDLNGLGHWHGGYSHARQYLNLMQNWAAQIDHWKGQLDKKGVKMINYNYASGVRRYEFRELESLVRG